MTATEPQSEPTAAKTQYVVLMLETGGSLEGSEGDQGPLQRWKKVGAYNGRTPEEAIRAYLTLSPGAAAAQFVAIAERWWNPRRPKVDTVTTITFEDA